MCAGRGRHKKDPASAAGGSRAGKSILEGFLQDGNTALHRSVKFVVVIILEQNQIVLVLRVGEVLRDGKVAPAQILGRLVFTVAVDRGAIGRGAGTHTLPAS